MIKYTIDSSELQSLLRVRRGRRGLVLEQPRPARVPRRPHQHRAGRAAAVYPINGYLWIPKGAPHPVLAQTFINWRLCPDVQFPNTWPIEHGPWSELSEGLLGPDYVDQIPDWFKADYYKYYLTLDQIKSNFKRSTGRPTTRASRSGWTTTPRRPRASDGPVRRRRTADPTVDGD